MNHVKRIRVTGKKYCITVWRLWKHRKYDASINHNRKSNCVIMLSIRAGALLSQQLIVRVCCSTLVYSRKFVVILSYTRERDLSRTYGFLISCYFIFKILFKILYANRIIQKYSIIIIIYVIVPCLFVFVMCILMISWNNCLCCF